MNVPRSAVWTAVLERRLREAGWPQADVVNLGLDGTGTDVHAALLERELPRLRPDVVVLAFFGNDFDDVLNGRFERECYRGWVLSYQSERQRDELRARVDAHLTHGVHRFWFDQLYLVRLLTLAVEGPRSLYHIQFVQPSAAELGVDDAVRRGREPAIERALDALERIARSCDCRFVVAPVPAKAGLAGSLEVFRSRTARPRVRDPRRCARARSASSDERRLALPDLFFVHDAHLNALGNELFGAAVFELLAPELPRPASPDPSAAFEGGGGGWARRMARPPSFRHPRPKSLLWRRAKRIAAAALYFAVAPPSPRIGCDPGSAAAHSQGGRS